MKRKDLISFRLFLLFLSVLLSALIFSACNNKKVTAIDGNFTTKEKGSSNDTGDNVPSKIRYSQGLIFSNASGGGKLVAGIGNCTDTELVIHPAPIDIGTVVGIADYAFEGESEEEQEKCAAITSISIPEGVTTIGRRAFIGCTGLQTIRIPNSITSIGVKALDGCENLQYNETDNGYYLGNEENPYVVLVRVKDKSVKAFSIPEQTRIIYTEAFADCTELESITIPDNVKDVGTSAFAGCVKLTGVVVPDNVNTLGAKAFFGCEGLKTITVGTGVTTIGESVFAGCNALESLTVPFVGETLDGSLHPFIGHFFGASSSRKNENECLQDEFVPLSLRTVVITGGTNIGNDAFYGCREIANIILPNSIVRIGLHAFHGCASLTSISIPDSVKIIDAEAFRECVGLISIKLPNQITIIEFNTFAGCTALKELTLGKNIKTLGSWVLQHCSALEKIYYPRSMDEWKEVFKADDLRWDAYTGNYVVKCSDGELPKS